MARIPMPDSVQDMKGAFALHPERAHPNEPKPDGPLGPAPAYLSKEEKVVWRELARNLIPGVAFHSDRLPFEALVRVASKMRHNWEKFKATDMAALISLSARFAMTPSDRTKVSVAKPKASAISKYLSPRAPRPPLPSGGPAAPGQTLVGEGGTLCPDLSVN
jgi:hypothetical protein